MGLDYPYAGHDISAADELNELRRRARHPSKKMRLLNKTHEFTFSNGTDSAYPDANLDHVVSADHLQFKAFDGCEVAVRGWPQAEDPDQWIRTYSDHALLYLEVQKVNRMA